MTLFGPKFYLSTLNVLNVMADHLKKAARTALADDVSLHDNVARSADEFHVAQEANVKRYIIQGIFCDCYPS